MGSPTPCTLKGKDGKNGARIAVDYRYLNKFHQDDDRYSQPDTVCLSGSLYYTL